MTARPVFPSALACDFDGTLASEDRIGPAARAALEAARGAGLRLILVTGRTLFELARVCDCLELFDAVVAENGGVLYLPGAAMLADQGPPPPARLLAELGRRGVEYEVGHVLVSAVRRDETQVRAALAASGVRLEMVYNRAYLMLLPAGLTKGTGVRSALRLLRLSAHDVVAFGDADNDLPLFEACGWSGCPGSAEPTLREVADWVFPGEDGESVAAAISGPVLHGLPIARSPRHRIRLGWSAATSEPVSIPARGVNVLIHGDSLSGKSWLSGSVLERLIDGRYAVCVLDPEGDYQVFAHRADTLSIQVRDRADVDRALSCIEQYPEASAILDLSRLPHAGKLEVIGDALRAMRDLRRRLGRPHWVMLDEAHYSLHARGVGDDALTLSDKGLCAVTYRPSWLRPRVVEAMDVVISARTSNPSELAFVGATFLDGCDHPRAALAGLPSGEFVLCQLDGDRRAAETFVAARRDLAHVRHLRKYADLPVAPELRFLFRRSDGQPVGTADSLHAFRRAVAGLGDDELGHHAGHGDFSRWVRDVFGDDELARQLGKVEARWRRGELTDVRPGIDRLIATRYGEA